MKTRSIIFSAFFLTISSLLAKFLGAFYRIPLTNILGIEGIGLYQLVFPIFSFILVLTSLGIPNAISKIISQKIALNRHNEIHNILNVSLIFFSVISLLLSILVFLGADMLSVWQGNPNSALVYKVIAPSIYFVGILSIFRGYFQGFQNIKPTSYSLLIEQLVKLVFGLLFAYALLYKGIEYSVAGAIFGVTLSEIIACAIIIIQFLFFYGKEIYPNKELYFNISQEILSQSLLVKKNRLFNRLRSDFKTLKEILKTTIPITLSSMILPAVAFIDSFLIINLLTQSGFDVVISTKMYGILTGIINSLINMPSVIAISIATILIPSITSLYVKSNYVEIERKAKVVIKLVLYISMAIFVVLLVAPKEILLLLYSNSFKSSMVNELEMAINLLQIASISVLFITFIQILTTILQAIDKSKIPIKNLFISCLIKILLTIILVSIPQVNIFGALFASILCYIVACLLDFRAVFKYIGINFYMWREIIYPVLAMVLMAIILKVSLLLLSTLYLPIRLIISVGLCISIYIILLLINKSIEIPKNFITCRKKPNKII